MMKFEKLIVTFTDMMEAGGYSVFRIQKTDTHTYIIWLLDVDEQGFEYVHGARRFIEEYCPRIRTEYSSKESGIIEIVFKEIDV